MTTKISVVIPTYNREKSLKKLLEKLKRQTLKDFEVIIVDSGNLDFKNYKKTLPYSLTLKKLPNKGCNPARNFGIDVAKSPIIAFTDDDCIPDDNWLEEGVKYFKNPQIVGIEGLICSEQKGDVTHRSPQTLERKNELVRGKTANMFYRKKILQEIDGFDERFEVLISRGRIGFRGDTDLAWRMEKYGKIPFGKDVKVYHPADKTTLKKELKDSKCFIFTSLLLKKHPDRFKDIISLTLFPITPSTPLKIFWLFYGIINKSKVR